MNKVFISLGLILLIVYSGIAYLALTNRPIEEYFDIGVLNQNMKAAYYFPDGNNTVKINSNITWYIRLGSFFRTPQIVKVVVKLGNNNTLLPDATSGTPSNGTEIFEWIAFLTYKNIRYYKFEWKVLNIINIEGYYYLELLINNTLVKKVDSLKAYKGQNFVLIFELWTLDTKSGDFMLGWFVNDQRKVAWLSMRFNATLQT